MGRKKFRIIKCPSKSSCTTFVSHWVLIDPLGFETMHFSWAAAVSKMNWRIANPDEWQFLI